MKATGRSIGVVDIFCGVGGLSYGLKSAGLKILAGFDLDPFCKYPFERNCKSIFVNEDVKKVTAEAVKCRFGGTQIRVLAGCAPCQPFSTYSQSRKSKDDRWQLLRDFLRLAIEIRPEVITMENVPRLAHNPVWNEFVAGLAEVGYEVSWDIVRCEEIGVPQTRQRLVLLASKRPGLKIENLERVKKPKTVKDAVGALEPLVAGGKSSKDILHTASRLSDKNMSRIKASRPGGTWRDWKKQLRASCHVRKGGETYPSVYGRMSWDEPAPTITTQFYGFGNGRFGHPEQNRAISIREAALLQSFPKAYKFVETAEDVSFRRLGILIGNAVPPLLGKAIGKAIKAHADASF